MATTITIDWTWKHGTAIEQDIIAEVKVAEGVVEIKQVGSYHFPATLAAGVCSIRRRVNDWIADTDPLAAIIIADLEADDGFATHAMEEADEYERDRYDSYRADLAKERRRGIA